MTDTTNEPRGEQDADFDIQEILAKRREIALIWSIDDVKSRRRDLNDDQCWRVLQECERRHNAEYGINWEAIEEHANDLFGVSYLERVERCDRALHAYEDHELVDLLADAMHWAKANDHDFDAVLRIGPDAFRS